MSKCETCGKQFHACSSCGLDHSWKFIFCCEKCYKESEDYHRIFKTCNDFLEVVPQSCYVILKQILEDEDYVSTIIEILSEKKLENYSFK